MKQRQIPRYLIGWVQAFTTERTIAFSFDGKSEIPKPFTTSIPQGSPVSPPLFAIAGNAFLENPITLQPGVNSSYIDDISMTQTGCGPAETLPLLKSRIEVCLTKAAHLGQSFSLHKSELLRCFPESSRLKSQNLDF
jgi:hypothetical protein